MYSFEGNYKSKRSLVFDHTQKLSTHALVQKTREERRSRENMVKQERSATKIQRCIRDYVERIKVKRYFIELFNELSNQLGDTINKSDFNVEHEFEHKLMKLLQCFNTCYRGKSPDQRHLFTVCRLLLSKHGKDAQISWLTNGSMDHIFTLGNSLLINIKYLSNLPSLTPSSNYTLPIRIFEELFNIFIGTSSSTKISLYSKHLYFSIEWICRYLSNHHYFNYLAYFIDQQLPSTVGYFQDVITQSRVFELVEFFKLPKARAFINLLIAPLKCASNLSGNSSQFSNPMVDLYRELVFTALNDILTPAIDDHNTYTIGERVVRSVGIEMFKLPNIHQIVINGCLTEVENKNSQLNTEQRQQQPHNGTISLIPSINLLHLFVTVAIPGMLVKCDPTTTTLSSTVHTAESSMIQDTDEDDDDNHEEAVTEEEGGDESLPVLLATESYTHYTWSGSPLEAAIIIRFVAWMFMRCLTEPHLPIVRPITNHKPLQLRSGQEEELSDDDDDNKIDDNHNTVKGMGINDQEMNMSAEFTRNTNNCSIISEDLSFQPITQLKKISVSLSHSLPALAASALSTVENFTSDLDNPDKLELIHSSSYLHYCLSQVCGLSRTSLIRINSIYSQHTIYLRCLWKLIENTKCSDKSTTINYSDPNMYSLLNILCSGELPSHLMELQSYLPLIFTFADCLHHRLLCLTDSEICDISSEVNYTNSDDYRHQQSINNNSEPSRGGCGFRADELLHVGARLRDLMLGLIDLSHPDQVPKRTRNLQTDTHCTESMEQPNYSAVLRRIKQWVEMTDLGNSPGGDLLMRNNTEWSIPDLRVLLYCWCSLLRQIERLVFQIYDWDRRCRRQQDISLPIYLLHNPQTTTTTTMTCTASTNVSSPFSSPSSSITDIARVTNSPRLPIGTPSVSQTFWLKDNLFDLLNTTESQSSWFENRGYQDTLALADAPFGYYSILNPDRNQAVLESFSLSNRQIRQILLLKKVPFVIPFEKRVKLFKILINDDSTYNRNPFRRIYNISNQPSVPLIVRRTHLYEDGFEKLSKENVPNLHQRLKVTFLNPTGLAEVGIDGGGLSREFLTEIIRAGFDPTRGFFIYASDKTLYPNPQASAITTNYLKHYYFLGRILAKAIFEGVLVDLQFAYFFLAKIVSRSGGGGVGFDYLHSLDPQLYKQLLFLKNYKGDVRDLSLDFTMVQSIFGQSETVELKPGGKHIPVTEENRVEYVHLIANYKLNKMIYPQVRAFTAGLNDVIPIDWVRLFDAEELQTLISGADMVIDVDDLRQHTFYIGNSINYTETLDCFWLVLKNFNESDKRSFLRFVTACSRPPMFGFRDLQPPFSIQITDEIERLPTASTCTNLLKLPNFRNIHILRERLLYALNANAGFEYG
uniref:HECT-type E3 ubiquitin transferase n=1 Tax=Schistosoma mansoni TaxID=6183 RepID=A0A5K4F0J4_SCHMA